VLVRRADNFIGLDQRYFRIAVRKRPENIRLLQETDAYLVSVNPERAAARNGGAHK
jgi:histidinol-phosphate/aromatic aminotransferase/cobyric acid decarboxylase-like protein